MSDQQDIPADGEGEGEAPAKRKPPLLVIIAAAVVLVLALGGVGAFLILGKKHPAETEAHESQGPSFEYGPHRDNDDENAQRAAALAKAAAEGGTPHAIADETNAPAPTPGPAPEANAPEHQAPEHKAKAH